MARILIIDDSLTVRMDLKEAFEAAAHAPTLCADAASARQQWSAHPFDLIVLDVLLPDGDGLELLAQLKANPATAAIPVMLLSTQADLGERLQHLPVPPEEYIGKPYDRDRLLYLAAQLLAPAAAAPTILVIDDSISFLHALADQLREEGMQVLLARSGQEGLDCLAQPHTVDCILLDLLMPGLSGQETCRRIKSSPDFRSIPVVMLTGLEDREAMLASFNAGADDFIPKSGDAAVLKARVRAQLRRKNFEEENRRIREKLHQAEMDAAEARAQHQLAETRAALLADLERKNAELEETNRGMRALYAELDERARSLQASSELQGKVVSFVSHELRTPLTSILLLSRLMLDEQRQHPLDPEQRQHMHYIAKAADTLHQMVNDLLDLASVRAGKLPVHPRQFQVDELFGTLRGLFRPMLADKPAVTLSFDAPPSLPPLHTDETKVGQILRNVIANALKFTEKGHVRVSASLQDQNIVFAVADTGIGIAPEDQQRIFEEFGQIDSPIQRRHKGTGLGLPLSRKLAEILGGSLRLQSAPGVGSTFFAEIPLRYVPPPEPRPAQNLAPPPPQPATASPPPSPVPARASVLIIDDDEIARFLLADLLSQAGCPAIEAASGPEGLELARRLKPRALFLDLAMPQMDGFEVLSRLKSDPDTRQIPVIVYSAKLLEPHQRHWLEGQVAAFFPKDDLPREQMLWNLNHALARAGLKTPTAEEGVHA